MKPRRRFPWSLVFAVVLLAANGLAWVNVISSANLPEVLPRLDPQIGEIRQHIIKHDAAGEPFSIVITNQMAAEAVAWFLDRHPEAPFGYPQVEFHPDGIVGRGIAFVFGLRTPVFGEADLTLVNGKPQVALTGLGVAGARLPDFAIAALQSEIKKQFDLAKVMPVDLSRLELGEGTLTVEGVFR